MTNQHWKTPERYLRVFLLGPFILLCLLGGPRPSFADEALNLFNQAHSHIQKGQYEDAAQSLKAAIKLFPRFAEAHHLLGVVYFTGFSQPDSAIASFKQAIAFYPNFSRAHHDLGIVFQHQKKYANAERAFQKALELYPRYLEARVSLANLYDQMKRPKKRHPGLPGRFGASAQEH